MADTRKFLSIVIAGNDEAKKQFQMDVAGKVNNILTAKDINGDVSVMIVNTVGNLFLSPNYFKDCDVVVVFEDDGFKARHIPQQFADKVRIFTNKDEAHSFLEKLAAEKYPQVEEKVKVKRPSALQKFGKFLSGLGADNKSNNNSDKNNDPRPGPGPFSIN